jgi:IS30 family transposase
MAPVRCLVDLSFKGREDLAILRAHGLSVREIARRMGRSPLTVSRKLLRNAEIRSGMFRYRATVAQSKSGSSGLTA